MKTITLTEEEQKIILAFLPIPGDSPKEPMASPKPDYAKLPNNLQAAVEALRLRLAILILLCAFATSNVAAQEKATGRDRAKMHSPGTSPTTVVYHLQFSAVTLIDTIEDELRCYECKKVFVKGDRFCYVIAIKEEGKMDGQLAHVFCPMSTTKINTYKQHTKIDSVKQQ